MTIKTEEKEEVDAVAGDGDGDGDGAAVGTSNAQREFPDAFYCPLTEKIMVDPVVDTSGESFERSAKIEKDKREKVTGATYYPNRALKTIIERELERHDEKGSIRGKVRALEESLRSGFNKLVEKSALPSAERRPLPDSFYCPITFELIRKPVIDPDGRTFERDAIVNWIRVNGTSPLTRNALAVSQLRSNEALRDLIEDEKERTDESIHPSIRRWKMEDQTYVQTVETGIRPVDPPGASHDRVDSSNDDVIRALVDDEGDTSGYQSDRATQVQRDSFRRQQQSRYPTTQAEINARRRQSVQSVQCSRPVIFIFLIIVMLASLFVFPILIKRARGVERGGSESGADY
jgi:hypothetical protein